MTKRYEGNVTKVIPNKNCAFIKAGGINGEVFIHVSAMPDGVLPKIGQRLQFDVVTTARGRQAANVVSANETGDMPDQKREQASKPNTKLQPNGRRDTEPGTRANNRLLPTPYTFVPVIPGVADNEAIDGEPSSLAQVPGHDGQSQEIRSSGELKLTLTAHTPLLVGARQYEFEPQTDSPFRPIADGKKRKLLEPWRLQDGRIVLAGSSLKGMIRHHLSALLNAPMEKVYEQYFSYRPNLSMGGPPGTLTDERGEYRIEMREAVITSVEDDGLALRILPAGRHALFTHESVVTSNNLNVDVEIKAGTNLSNTSRPQEQRKDRRTGELKPAPNADGTPKLLYRLAKASPHVWTSDRDYRLLHYLGGMGRDDSMAAAHGSPKYTYKWAVVPKDSIDQAGNSQVDERVLREYLRTYRELSDDQHGHLSSRHPKFGVGARRPRLLPTGARRIPFEKDTLVYVETKVRAGTAGETHEVVALGHHFHFRLAYRDSVRVLDHSGSPRTRPELGMQPGEYVGIAPDGKFVANLSAARALFGYAADTDLHGTVFKGHFERLAGRISVNHALECLEPSEAKSPSRFLEKGRIVPLKELGSPKASAVEFYLQQNEADNKAGRLTTYGDLADDEDSRLAGRKFYRHQPKAATESSGYCAQGDDVRNDRAVLTRFASCPGTQFRFTLRYHDLSSEELGALLFVLSINRADAFMNGQPPKDATQQIPYALKLGHARPLGWGSVTATVDQATELNSTTSSASVLNPLSKEELPAWEKKHIEAFLKQMAPHKHLILTCLNAWSYAGRGAAAYPSKDSEIFNFHTDLRRRHSKARRSSGTAITETELVKPEFGSKGRTP